MNETPSVGFWQVAGPQVLLAFPLVSGGFLALPVGVDLFLGDSPLADPVEFGWDAAMAAGFGLAVASVFLVKEAIVWGRFRASLDEWRASTPEAPLLAIPADRFRAGGGRYRPGLFVLEPETVRFVPHQDDDAEMAVTVPLDRVRSLRLDPLFPHTIVAVRANLEFHLDELERVRIRVPCPHRVREAVGEAWGRAKPEADPDRIVP